MVILKITKLDTMIDDSIMKGTHIETTDDTLKELPQFQDLKKLL